MIRRFAKSFGIDLMRVRIERQRELKRDPSSEEEIKRMREGEKDPQIIVNEAELKTNRVSPKAMLATASRITEAPAKIPAKMETAGIAIERLSVAVHRNIRSSLRQGSPGMNFIEKTALTIRGKGKRFEKEGPPQIIGTPEASPLHKGPLDQAR